MRTVASRTSLTKSQVAECFDTTWDIIEQMLLQPQAPLYFEFIMGNLGKLTVNRIVVEKLEYISDQTDLAKVNQSKRLWKKKSQVIRI